jgi:DNA modification methylase
VGNGPIERVALDSLKPAEWNPRTIKDARFKELCKSLAADPDFMESRPILATADGTIYAGNMRYRAAAFLKWPDVPAVIADIPEQLAKERALRDNNAWGEWQDDQLAEMVYDLKEMGSDLSLLGFEPVRMEELLALSGQGEEAAEDPGAQVDRAGELREKWQTERGQIWACGNHRLMCGDSTDAADVFLLMANDKVEMVWTDPPYGVAVGDKNKYLNSIARSNRVEENLTNDTLDEPALVAMLEKAFDAAITHCLAGAAWYVAAPPGPLHVLFGQVLKDRGIWHQTIQWVKNNATFSPLGVDYHWRAEPIFYGWLPGAAHRYYGGRKQDTVWEIDRPTKSPEHPTMKPVELVARAIENSSQQGEVVYDAFGGSGTTLVAAEQAGRLGRAMELEPKYVAVTLERLSQMGLSPVLLDA